MSPTCSKYGDRKDRCREGGRAKSKHTLLIFACDNNQFGFGRLEFRFRIKSDMYLLDRPLGQSQTWIGFHLFNMYFLLIACNNDKYERLVSLMWITISA